MSASTAAVVLAVFVVVVLLIGVAVLALPALVIGVAGAVLVLFGLAAAVGRVLARVSRRYPEPAYQPAPEVTPDE